MHKGFAFRHLLRKRISGKEQRTNFLEEQIKLHAEELRERIVQAESITVKIKMESIDHKIDIYSFDLPPEILAEWKQVADISLNAEQGSM